MALKYNFLAETLLEYLASEKTVLASESIYPIGFSDRKDMSFHMVECPKRVVQCAVPGCHVMLRLAEVEVHNRESKTKHLNLFEIDRQKKAWSLYEVRVFLLMVIK